MINNDPRSYDARDEWLDCPQCRAATVLLANYEISDAGYDPASHSDLPQFLWFGWLTYALDYVSELFSFGGRESKLARLKRETLPQFPRSLVCPRCLHVIKRG